MSNDVLVIAEHVNGKINEISYEMAGKARELAGKLGGQAIVLLAGNGMDAQAATFNSDVTLYVDDPALAHFNPEAYARVVEAVVAEKSPRLVMIGYTSIGMDLASWLSVKAGLPCCAYVNGLDAGGGGIVASSQVYAGRMISQAAPVGDRLIATVLAGSFPGDAGKGSTSPQKTGPPVGLDGMKTKFVRLVLPEAGDVDITTQDKLVAVGRGFGSQDDIELAEELAEALGATVVASRPITDAGWLPKSRQVGKSGVTVKPKLYLMLGISGAPEHIEGMKDSELIIAVNTDENAPIFDYAHYGTTADLFDVAEALLELLG